MCLIHKPTLRETFRYGQVKASGILTALPGSFAPAAGGGGNAFTLVGTPVTQESTNTITCGQPTAGNLMVILASCEGTGAFYTGCTRGADTFTAGNLIQHSNNDLSMRFFYHLAASSDATTTATCTATGTPAFQKLISFVFSATGTHSLDTQATGAQGNSTTPASGTMTTSATTGLAIGGIGLYGTRTKSAQKIGSTNATTTENTIGSAAMWDLLFSGAALSGVTANCTISSAVEWVCSEIAFKSL